MRLPAAIQLSAALLSTVSCGTAVAAPASAHPIVGIWRLSLPELGCTETYRFRTDGTTLVTSAAEVTESRYTIPRQPSPGGFYRLIDTITKDNGKKDCSGNVMKVGQRATNFVRFHPSGEMFVLCKNESMEVCIGPFQRVRGEEV